jgi:hypothetical protein
LRHLATFKDASTLTVGVKTTTGDGVWTVYTFNDSGTIGWS